MLSQKAAIFAKQHISNCWPQCPLFLSNINNQVWNKKVSTLQLNHSQSWFTMLLTFSRWALVTVYKHGHVCWTNPEQTERVLLPQLLLYLVDGSLQTGDLHAQQGLVLVQADQLSPLLRLQLHLQQLLLLVQELVQVAELGLDALLQVSGVLLNRWKVLDIGTGRDRLHRLTQKMNVSPFPTVKITSVQPSLDIRHITITIVCADMFISF